MIRRSRIARPPLRGRVGFDFNGRVFEATFVIADVKMKADFPTGRRYGFESPVKSGASALLHKRPDAIGRIDVQRGRNLDRGQELQPARIRARVDAGAGCGVLPEVPPIRSAGPVQGGEFRDSGWLHP